MTTLARRKPLDRNLRVPLDLAAHTPTTDPQYQPRVVNLVGVFAFVRTEVGIMLEDPHTQQRTRLSVQAGHGPLHLPPRAHTTTSTDDADVLRPDADVLRPDALGLLLSTPLGRDALLRACTAWEALATDGRDGDSVAPMARRGLALIWAAAHDLDPQLREAMRDAAGDSPLPAAELGHAFTIATST